jgi:hypothetical protein
VGGIANGGQAKQADFHLSTGLRHAVLVHRAALVEF